MDGPLFGRQAICENRFAKASGASLHGRRTPRIAHKCETWHTEPKQMLGRHEAGAAIINPDQIVTASIGKRQHASIQKNDGNSGFVEPRENFQIHPMRFRRYFERSKKDAGESSLEE